MTKTFKLIGNLCQIILHDLNELEYYKRQSPLDIFIM